MTETSPPLFPRAPWAILSGLLLSVTFLLAYLVVQISTATEAPASQSIFDQITPPCVQFALTYGWIGSVGVWHFQRALEAIAPARPLVFCVVLLALGTPLAFASAWLIQSGEFYSAVRSLFSQDLPLAVHTGIIHLVWLVTQIMAALLASATAVWAGGSKLESVALPHPRIGGIVLQAAALALGMYVALMPGIGALDMAMFSLLPESLFMEHPAFYSMLQPALVIALAAIIITLWPRRLQHGSATMLAGLGVLMVGLSSPLWMGAMSVYEGIMEFSIQVPFAVMALISEHPKLPGLTILGLLVAGTLALAAITGVVSWMRTRRQQAA